MFRKYLVLVSALIGFAITMPAAAGVIFIPIFVPTKPMMITNPADYKAIHTVAVVSAVGTELNMRNVHFLGTKEKSLDIRGWKLDDEITGMLKTYLGNRFQFKDIAYDRVALAHTPDDSYDIRPKALANYAKGLTAPGVDAFILLRPALEQGDPGIKGIALDNGNGLSDVLPVIWANYEIDIIDAHTFELIGQCFSRVALRAGARPSFAGIVAPPELTMGDDFTLTDKQQSLLHGFVTKLVQLSLIETIRALNFDVPLPEAGARTLIPIPPDKAPYKDIKSIAVVSTVGDHFELRKWGAIWARGTYSLPIADWNIDSTVERDVRNALDKRFTVKDVPIDRHALLQAHLLNDDGKFDPSFPGLTATNDVDAYLVVLRFGNDGSWQGPGHMGLGMLHVAVTLGGDDSTAAYASYVVALVDAHTLKIVAAHRGTQSPDRSTAEPVATLANTLWPDSPPKFNTDQATQVRTSLTDLLNDSIPETLLRLGLTGMMPAEGLPPLPAGQIAAQ